MKPIVLLVAATAAALAVVGAGAAWAGLGPAPSLVFAWIVLSTAHGVGVHFDGQRRRADVGAWPAAAAATGPLALVAYLVAAYGPRSVAWSALYLGLLSLLVGAAVLPAVWFTPICALPWP